MNCLGFAISRTPSVQGEATSWLPNRIDFNGPAPQGTDYPSNQAPVQKFMWWDARINTSDRGEQIRYDVTPVVGQPGNLQLLNTARGSLDVTIPSPVEHGIGTYFNRAVVSSQAFVKRFTQHPQGSMIRSALAWLANGLENVVPSFLSDSPSIEGAIYHLTDEVWIIPKLIDYQGTVSLVYNDTKNDHTNAEAVDQLEAKMELTPRTKARLMHDKFLVRMQNDEATAVLTGSANFTTEGIATQANLLHTFDSPELAALYLKRKKLLDQNPTLGNTAKEAGWSKVIRVGDARVRAFFPPEPRPNRESIDAITEAVVKTRKSVLFCLFMPTDKALRDAIFEAADRGRMMFGLINTISKDEPDGGDNAAAEARVEIFHRSQENRDVYAHSLYPKADHPAGFWCESSKLEGVGGQKFPVYIHHKFVIIDAETTSPIIYTGSANMSGNAVWYNDENLLEITKSPRLAAIYLAEFLRLYEHYRARAQWQRWTENRPNTYKLQQDAGWAKKYYRKGSPEYKSRIGMAGG